VRIRQSLTWLGRQLSRTVHATVYATVLPGAMALCACSSGGATLATAGRAGTSASDPVEPSAPPPRCDAVGEASLPLSGVDPRHLTLEFWLEHLGSQYDLDAELLTPAQVRAYNRSMLVAREGYEVPLDLLARFDVKSLADKVQERRNWAQDKLASGELLGADGRHVTPEQLEPLSADLDLTRARPELRVVIEDAKIHCAPWPSGFYSAALDLRLDRNACSTLRAQEVVRVVAEWPGGMRLVQAAYSFGWLAADAVLSPPVPERLAAALVAADRLQVHGRELSVGRGDGALRLAPGTLLAAADERGRRAYVATRTGFEKTAPADRDHLRSTGRGLTRRELLREAFRHLGTDYGLGGSGGGLDCSRFLMSTFQSFGIGLPRHSSWQARAGSFSIDAEGLTEAERLLLIDAAAR
jgi:hypothetical protein